MQTSEVGADIPQTIEGPKIPFSDESFKNTQLLLVMKTNMLSGRNIYLLSHFMIIEEPNTVGGHGREICYGSSVCFSSSPPLPTSPSLS
jgi:hypothetical protein